MTNLFLNNQEYANTMLLLVKNQLVAGRLVDGRFHNEVTDNNGLSISVKRPPRFIAKSGAALATQDVVTGSETVAVDQYKNVHISIGDLESVQSYNELMRNTVMMSAASTLAHDVDQFIYDKFKVFGSWIGTPGQDISSPAQFNPAHTRLMNQAVPNSDLYATLTFEDGEGIRSSLTATDISGINRTALERTRIPMLSEIDVYATNNWTSITTGSRTNGTVSGGGQEVNYRDVKDSALLSQTLDLAGVGNNNTIKKGDTFTIAGVFAVNPRTQQRLPYLRQFVVTEDVTASGTGTATVRITPPIIVSGSNDSTGDSDTNTAHATVNALPANGAAVTWLGAADTTTPVRAAFHKQAVSLVSAQLRAPATGEYSFATDPETGISIRYWRGSDISTGEHIHRWDMIYGAQTMDTTMGVRINGTA